jgi:hypothetical protein
VVCWAGPEPAVEVAAPPAPPAPPAAPVPDAEPLPLPDPEPEPLPLPEPEPLPLPEPLEPPEAWPGVMLAEAWAASALKADIVLLPEAALKEISKDLH